MATPLPSWKLAAPPGGLSIWAELPEPMSTGVASITHRYGLSVAAGLRFGMDGAFAVHAIAIQPVGVIGQAVDRLALAFDAIRPKERISGYKSALV